MSVFYALTGIFICFWLLGLVFFFRKRKEKEIIFRSWEMVLFSSTFGLAYFIYFAVTMEMYFKEDGDDFAQFCIPFNWVHFAFAPGLSVVTRSFLFSFLFSLFSFLFCFFFSFLFKFEEIINK